MRAAIYARYSSDNQRDSSIEDQVRLCQAYIEREGWTLIQTFADHAISGASTLRPGYQALLEAARHGKIDVVIAEALDRLSRDLSDIAHFHKLLSFANVRLITIGEGEIGDLHIGLKGTMNALYLKDLALKTHRGLEGRVRKGLSGGGLCYGYDVVRKHDAAGEPVRGERSINENEARIVRRIFKEFADGKSPRAIARALNADGIPGPSGATWGPSTINGNKERGTGILNNELYIGRLVWNRLRYVKNPSTGKRISRLNPPEAWIVHEVQELRVVEQELWDRVKKRQKAISKPTRPDSRTPQPFWAKTRPRYLFSGLMKCGACGGNYVKISANRFGCAAARDKGVAVCNNLLTVRRDSLEKALLDGLRHGLMDPELFAEFATEFHREFNRLQREDDAKRGAVRDEFARIERRLAKLVDLVLDTDQPPQILVAEMRSLEARKAEIEVRLDVPEEPRPLIHPNLAEVYRHKVAELNKALDEDASRDEAIELIRTLIERITLTPSKNELQINLKGELAGILELCQAGKTKHGADSSAGSVQQIKMVAGAGFVQAPTIQKVV
jgi:site-specific DNA recombinase